jgi:hypothetical protein
MIIWQYKEREPPDGDSRSYLPVFPYGKTLVAQTMVELEGRILGIERNVLKLCPYCLH